jgi:hypothetical protein
MKPWKKRLRRVAGVLSALSVSITIYTFVQALFTVPKRLWYTEEPPRRSVFDTTLLPDYRLMLGSRPLDRNVWAARIVLWNDSRQAIRPPFYRPIRISVAPGAEILRAIVVKQTAADICRVAVDERRPTPRSIDIVWQTLERDDGAAIDVVYAGARDTAFQVTGAFEGQRSIGEGHWVAGKGGVWILVGLFAAAIPFLTVALWLEWRHNPSPGVIFWTILIILGWLCTLYLVFALLRTPPAELLSW